MPTPSFILPSAPVYEEGTLYGLELYGSNFVPSPMSFTRATTATRVNADGLVELVPYNLFTYSEQFDNGYWVKLNGNALSNTTTAPNGTLTADSFTKTSGINTVSEVYNSSFLTTGVHTLSVYIKPNIGNSVLLRLDRNGNSANAQFNFTTKTFVNSGANILSSSFVELDGGWFRLIVTANVIASNWQISACNLFSNPIGDSMFIWGAQLVEGTEALPYLKTETRLNRPRVDFSLPGCPNLLLEPQRTNVATYSEDITQWAGSLSVTANNTISPDGTQNADKVTSSGSTQTRFRSFSGNANCTISIFAKKVDSDYILISYGEPSTRYAIFRFSDGVCTTATSGITTTSTNYGNGWWRFSMSTTSLSAGYIELCPNASGTSRNSAGSCYVWGAQYENLASYATSYIPTTSATVTRNQDVCVKTGISSLINSAEGVLYAEIAALDLTNSLEVLSLSDGTFNNVVFFRYYDTSSNDIQVQVKVAGVVQVSILVTLTNAKDFNKIAFKYKENDFALWVNGVNVGTDISGSTFAANTLSKFAFDRGDGSNPMFANVQNLMVFPTVLSDDELEVLTGLGFDTYAEMANYYNYITQ